MTSMTPRRWERNGLPWVSAGRPDVTGLWAAAAVSLAISLTPWSFLLYPFKLFTTWIHECGHAVAAILVGGQVSWITIAPDTSGLTQSLVPADRVSRGIVASAGYLGSAVVGCLLMAATRVRRSAHLILLGIAALMLLTLALWVRNLFGAGALLVGGTTLLLIARRDLGPAARFVLSLLAIQVALNAVYDIRVLFLLDGGRSDAVTMAELFLMPPWLWAGLWMAMAVGLLGATLWLTRRP